MIFICPPADRVSKGPHTTMVTAKYAVIVHTHYTTFCFTTATIFSIFLHMDNDVHNAFNKTSFRKSVAASVVVCKGLLIPYCFQIIYVLDIHNSTFMFYVACIAGNVVPK